MKTQKLKIPQIQRVELAKKSSKSSTSKHNKKLIADIRRRVYGVMVKGAGFQSRFMSSNSNAGEFIFQELIYLELLNL